MNVTAKSWVRIIGSTAGAALAGPGGAVLGSLAGGLLMTVLPGLPDFLGDVLDEFATGTFEKAGEAIVHQLSEGEKSRINYDLQTAFRDAFREAIYDVGGRRCFPKAWRRARIESSVRSRVVYSETPQGETLWREKDTRAEQVCDCLQKMERTALEGGLLPLEPPKDRPAADVHRYLEAETHQALSQVFFEQVVSPYLQDFRSLIEELPDFETHLRRHLLDRTLVHVGELLKDPSRTQAWRAFNRLMLEEVRGEVRQLKTGQSEILNRLDVLLEQSGEPAGIDWTDGLADLLTAVGQIEKQMGETFDAVMGRVAAQHGELLDRMDKVVVVAQRTEGKVDQALHMLGDVRHLVETRAAAVSGLRPPDTQPIIAPRLPTNLLEREQELDDLRHLVLGARVDGYSGLIAVQGMGGVGKSVLVASLCYEPDVQRAFPDGVIWVWIGRSPGNLVDQMKAIGVGLGDSPFYYTSPEASVSRLSAILATRSVLVVLDDVWDPEHVNRFRFDAPRCHIVFTTRSLAVARSLGAATLKLGVLAPVDAVTLLREISGSDSPELAEIAECLGYLPLALSLAGKRLQEGITVASWLERYREHVMELRLDRHSVGRHANLEACFDVSSEQFPPEDRLLYHSLGVFPEGIWIPQQVVMRLWRQLAPQYEQRELGELIESLARLALIDLGDEGVSLHDLLHDYNRHKLERVGKWSEYQAAILSAYNAEARPWHTVKHDGYIYYHLPYHMVNAGREDELLPLLRTTTRWMEKTLDEPDMALEGLVVMTWHRYWKTHREEARDFLIRKWLPRKTGLRRQEGYTARVVAVRCAFEVGCDEGLAAALCHSDGRVRSVAATYAYYLSQHESVEELGRALSILKAVGAQAAGLGLLPDTTALRSVFLLAPLLVTDQFQAGNLDTPIVREIVSVLRDTIRDITTKSALRFVGPRARIFAVQVGARVLLHLLKTAESSSINSLDGVALFFSQPEEMRNRTREALVYLDRTYGSADEVSEHILDVANSISSWDRISGLLADYIFYGRAVHCPAMAQDLLPRVASNDDPTCLSLLLATHLYCTVMDRQPDAAITDSVLETMRAFVTKWLDTGKHGYGCVRYRGRNYQFHPLGFYAGLWTKACRGVQIDLFEMYADRAARENDVKLKLHIIATFGDFRQILYDYPTALRILVPYIQGLASRPTERPDLAPEDPIRKQLVESLGALRGLRPAPVDAFLHQVETPVDLVSDIRAFSYQKPFLELYYRFYQVLADVVAYAPVEFVQQIIRILEKALAARSVDQMAAVLVDELIMLAEGSEPN